VLKDGGADYVRGKKGVKEETLPEKPCGRTRWHSKEKRKHRGDHKGVCRGKGDSSKRLLTIEGVITRLPKAISC